MTVFGDMETATLTELPAGRQPITTHVVDEAKPGWVERTWARVAEEVGLGHQAYVVCPKIGDPTDGTTLTADTSDEDDGWDRAGRRGGGAAYPPVPARPSPGCMPCTTGCAPSPALAGLRTAVLHRRPMLTPRIG
jgi:ATP-dependent DNA helicase RecG